MGYDMTEASSEESSAELQEEIKWLIYELNAFQLMWIPLIAQLFSRIAG